MGKGKGEGGGGRWKGESLDCFKESILGVLSVAQIQRGSGKGKGKGRRAAQAFSLFDPRNLLQPLEKTDFSHVPIIYTP